MRIANQGKQDDAPQFHRRLHHQTFFFPGCLLIGAVKSNFSSQCLQVLFKVLDTMFHPNRTNTATRYKNILLASFITSAILSVWRLTNRVSNTAFLQPRLHGFNIRYVQLQCHRLEPAIEAIKGVTRKAHNRANFRNISKLLRKIQKSALCLIMGLICSMRVTSLVLIQDSTPIFKPVTPFFTNRSFRLSRD